VKFIYSGIRIRNLNRSIKFYTNLGLKVEGKGTMGHCGKFVSLIEP
jgi:catechol 2,3-dioxygenase-like lactoylglutathione lyase family enzyme